MNQGIVWAFMGTGFTFLMTAFGASVVFILKNDMGKNLQRAFMKAWTALQVVQKR